MKLVRCPVCLAPYEDGMRFCQNWPTGDKPRCPAYGEILGGDDLLKIFTEAFAKARAFDAFREKLQKHMEKGTGFYPAEPLDMSECLYEERRKVGLICSKCQMTTCVCICGEGPT